MTLPKELMTVMLPFVTLFSETVWDYAQILMMGAILAPGKRTVSAMLTVMGLKDDMQYQNYYRVLNRAQWSSLVASQVLLGLLVAAFAAVGVCLIIGADETLERRRGESITQKSVFRDAVRSSKKHTVFSFGLRWVSMMLIVSLPWSTRCWALPFLTVNAPSEKTNIKNGKEHKTSIDWIMYMIGLVRSWLPTREIVLVTDGGLTAVKLGLTCNSFELPVTWVSRLRLDAVLHDTPAPQPKSKRGPKPKKGKRLPSLASRLKDENTKWVERELDWYGGKKYKVEYATGTALWYRAGFDPLPIRWVLVRDPAGKYESTAFLCTDQQACPIQILNWFILRWNVEVTFQEARALLGVETQRQWSDKAIARTTPALMGLFSLVVLFAHYLTRDKTFPIRTSAWYKKKEPTFSDALAVVRRYLWENLWGNYIKSASNPDYHLIPTRILDGLVDSMCYTT